MQWVVSCLKQAVAMGEGPRAWGNTLVTRERDSCAPVLLLLPPAQVREGQRAEMGVGSTGVTFSSSPSMVSSDMRQG